MACWGLKQGLESSQFYVRAAFDQLSDELGPLLTGEPLLKLEERYLGVSSRPVRICTDAYKLDIDLRHGTVRYLSCFFSRTTFL